VRPCVISDLCSYRNKVVGFATNLKVPILLTRADLSVDNILKGTNRASWPVEQPIKLEFVINLRNDRALGADVLQSCWPVPTRR
jgi:hypothetical protein